MARRDDDLGILADAFGDAAWVFGALALTLFAVILVSAQVNQQTSYMGPFADPQGIPPQQ